ncbi:HAD family hydrolase [candidate division WOR-3 bacterium]|nr:HAD family hydrolase [candidate division WOR-3 bacterium]
MKNVKIIAIDLDGTLISSETNYKISKTNIRALKKAIERGIHIAIITGRNNLSARMVLDETGDNIIKNLPLSLQNGSILIEGNTGTLLKAYDLDKNVARSIIRDMRNEDIGIMLYDNIERGLSIFVEKREFNIAIESYLQSREKRISDERAVVRVNSIEQILDFNPIQIATIDRETIIDKFIKILDSRYKNLVKVIKTGSYLNDGNWWWVEVFNKSCSKRQGLKDICELYNVDVDNSVYIGDNFNDIEAMQQAGFSIAVENAPEDIKKICNMVVRSSNNNGVAEAIDFILGGNI